MAKNHHKIYYDFKIYHFDCGIKLEENSQGADLRRLLTCYQNNKTKLH